MTRVGYLDCIGGVAGDMVLGALVDAGADLATLQELPGLLGLRGVEITAARTERQGIGALRVTVQAPSEQPQRSWADIRDLIGRSSLPESVREGALQVFERLAIAEARVHAIPPEQVHFHEVGAIDAIIDICGAVALFDELGIEELVCSPLPVGRGIIGARHGSIPLPAPATLELLSGVELEGVECSAELVTPTGAALAVSLSASWGRIPNLVLEAIGYGAGERSLEDRPNVVRLLIGQESTTSVATGFLPARELVLVETNIDDLNPEIVPDAMARCFSAGAVDVWTAPIHMKKGRPGLLLSALVQPEVEADVVRAIVEETSAIGVRATRVRRYELERHERRVKVSGGSVRVKVATLDGRAVNSAPEHDDCASIAAATGRSVKEVWTEAVAVAARRDGAG